MTENPFEAPSTHQETLKYVLRWPQITYLILLGSVLGLMLGSILDYYSGLSDAAVMKGFLALVGYAIMAVFHTIDQYLD